MIWDYKHELFLSLVDWSIDQKGTEWLNLDSEEKRFPIFFGDIKIIWVASNLNQQD
jgi:hypothetical protein